MALVTKNAMGLEPSVTSEDQSGLSSGVEARSRQVRSGMPLEATGRQDGDGVITRRGGKVDEHAGDTAESPGP